jgi:hypothetical protein
MSNIKVDLKPLFESLEKKHYCVVKLPFDFPDYKLGSDLDIFCYDIENIGKVVLSFLKDYIGNDQTILIKNLEKQLYVDILHNDKIHFRFDIYGSLPCYRNIHIKEAFFSSVIDCSIIVEQNGCRVKVPSQIDESILRYIEYQEWYGQRPDKIKHINYLSKKIMDDEIDVESLLDKVHYFTELPRIKHNIQVSRSSFVLLINELFYKFKKFIVSINENGLAKTLLKIKNSFIN